ncbi:arginine metabolism regulation protein iii [Paecilomyces variotii]|uniref:Kinase n=1 Tax=Byssochlamys spectabilis TaxID=264951 RepID=A0A443I1K8_BYSSP|nr:arginine metabolism regulation protein iii [Paecilomyces variotii]KAJ9222774.1 hypothetical protein DTO169C6_4979 [Paecilomyces variotii]KAJ9259916.1 hypothetical protein DTO207G8_613 [Paecilomyces variotii]KAJ9362193.1 hypothetical protein DTO280E4_3443 [Paecilomyces variotii]KAJ9392725.1 hypothetical protein DTO063F5_525 [Paecilomyces variotii]RWQ97950.1 arginine metabolism regulation protein iii [Paecilomyces variotii]
MPSPSKSDSRKAPKLDGDSFVAFDHAAAGHDGVRCDPSGSLIAKPCTREEIAFYESSSLHPHFRAFMPTFIGTLSSADQQQSQALAQAQQAGAIVVPPSDAPSSSNTPVSSGTSLPVTDASGQGTPIQKQDPWVPSGGRKLETGLSIVLENVASGFKRPNVLDVKLGARLWADDAPPSKRAKLDAVSKETTSSTLGFRIAGMKVWTGGKKEGEEEEPLGQTDPYATKYEASEGKKGEVIEKGGYKRYDKWYGRSFNAENVKEAFETFLAGAKASKEDRSKLIARRIAEELRCVQSVLEAEESRMYSASVLIVYEGDSEAMEEALEYEKNRKDDEEEDEEEDEDGEEFTLPQDGSLEVVDVKVGDQTLAQGALKLDIDPGTAATELGDLQADDEEEPPKVHDLRLIDFAHASWTPGQGPDENVLMGVRSLVKIMEDLAKE